jgi:hypothetical protein
MAKRKYNGNGKMFSFKTRRYLMYGTALAVGILAPKFLPADWYAFIATKIGLEVS